MTNLINLQDRKTEMDTDKSLAVKIMVGCLDTKFNATELPKILKEVYKAVRELKDDELETKSFKRLSKKEISDSVHDDYLVCLEDGVKLKMLKRHLKSKYQMTFREYKEKWNLPEDYPSVCASYSKTRSTLAKGIGLGKGNKKGISKIHVVQNKPILIDIEGF